MPRLAFPVTALAIAIMACSLGPTQSTEETAPTESGSAGGGVPISKATSTAAEGGPSPTEAVIQPTPVQQSTQAQTPVPVGPGAGELPIVVTDLNILGTLEFPRLIGIVRNVSGTDLFHVNLTVVFYDAAGDVADTRYGTTFMTTLPSGEVSPFEFFFPPNVPASVEAEAVGVTVEWEEVYPGYAWSRDGFSVLSPQGSMGPYNFEITGQVQNNSGKNARSVNIVAIAYNAAGQIIGYGLKVLDSVSAGSNVQFDMGIAGGTSLAEPQVDHFEVLVEGLLEG